MEWIDQVWNQVAQWISVPYLIIFMLVAYAAKKYLGVFLDKITKTKWKTVYTVLVIATLLAIPFLIWSDEGWIKIAVSYTVATSLYDLVFQWVDKKLT